ncbi:MAG TPA: VWA domain-containing protein [Burkholderiales bacterium]
MARGKTLSAGESTADGRLAENVMHFARVLRAAGLPIGPDRMLDAVRSLEVTGVERRDDFYWTLASVFLDRREQFEIYDQAFHIFWRDPQLLERVMAMFMPPQVHGRQGRDELRDASNRVAEALNPKPKKPKEEPAELPQETELDATLSFSSREVLKHADFETMTNEEISQAKKMLANLHLPIPEIRTRRFESDPHGARVDLRGSLRASLRNGGKIIPLKRRSPQRRHPPLVVLCDVSGSMNRYSRMFLHFLHAITNDRDRVTSFVFGTRLTNISRYLRHRDVDAAMSGVSDAIADWSGGTRIGQCLAEFNLRWSRRVLGQNAVVLMISDGLDGDVGEGLPRQMERLHKSCRKLIWLNPLLRYEGFEARPAGVRAMLPHVDEFLPVHNVASLIDLARALEGSHQHQRAA